MHRRNVRRCQVRWHTLTPDPLLIPTRHQRRSSRRAFLTVGVEVREAHALFRQAVNLRRSDVGCAVSTDVAVAEVVGHDEDNVRLTPLSRTAAFLPEGRFARPRVEAACSVSKHLQDRLLRVHQCSLVSVKSRN